MRNPRASRRLVLIALALIAGCGDIAGDAMDVSVRVDVTGVSPPVFQTDADSMPWLMCQAYLAAEATGSGAAYWQGATARFFSAAAPSVPFDSIVLSSSETRAFWNDDGFYAGQTQRAIVPVAASVPFHVTIEFRYGTDAGKGKSSNASIKCGERQGDTTAVPAITTFNVVSDAPELEPGGTLIVSYTASSPFGLWQTVVALSGACHLERKFAEKLPGSVERTIAIRLPSSCTLGAVPRVGVYAIDGRLQETARSLQLSSPLVDRTPPSIGTRFIQPASGEVLGVVAGTFFVGQTIGVEVTASDNHQIRALTWEVPNRSLRDSVVAADSSLTHRLTFEATADLIGPLELQYHARDAAGLHSDTVATAPGALRIYPTATRAVVEEDLPSGFREQAQVVFDDVRGVLYTSDEVGVLYRQRLDSLGVAFAEALQMPRMRGLDISPTGDSLLTYLPDQWSLAIIGLRTSPRPVDYLPLDSVAADTYASVLGLRAVSGGRVFLLILSSSNGYRLLEVSLSTGAQRWHSELGPSLVPYLLRTPDHSTLFVADHACLRRFDSSLGSFGGCLSRRGSLPTTSDLHGQVLAAGDSIYDGSLNFLRRVETPLSAPIARPTLTADGRELFYLVGYAGLVRSNVADGQLVDRSILSHYTEFPGDLFITRDGARVISVREIPNHSLSKSASVIMVR
jgi:hypothetical protein